MGGDHGGGGAMRAESWDIYIPVYIILACFCFFLQLVIGNKNNLSLLILYKSLTLINELDIIK